MATGLAGWVATKLSLVHTLHGFFNLSTWLTAIGEAAILLADDIHVAASAEFLRTSGSL